MHDEYHCPNPKCGYAIAADTLNHIQLKALERWGKTCPNCKQFGSFTKQQTLFDTQTNQTFNGGTENHATNIEDHLTPDGKRRKPNRNN